MLDLLIARMHADWSAVPVAAISRFQLLDTYVA